MQTIKIFIKVIIKNYIETEYSMNMFFMPVCVLELLTHVLSQSL